MGNLEIGDLTFLLKLCRKELKLAKTSAMVNKIAKVELKLALLRLKCV